MNVKILIQLKNYLNHVVTLFLPVVVAVMLSSFSAYAEKHNVIGKKSETGEGTVIGLDGSENLKFYYLFKVGENNEMEYVRAQIGNGKAIDFGFALKEEGTYVVYEFASFKERPFDFDKYDFSDGTLQIGEVMVKRNNSTVVDNN